MAGNELLALVWQDMLACGAATEYENADGETYQYGHLGVVSKYAKGGTPVRSWVRRGETMEAIPFDGTIAPLQFHMDPGNRRILIVLGGGCLSGGAWVRQLTSAGVLTTTLARG